MDILMNATMTMTMITADTHDISNNFVATDIDLNMMDFCLVKWQYGEFPLRHSTPDCFLILALARGINLPVMP